FEDLATRVTAVVTVDLIPTRNATPPTSQAGREDAPRPSQRPVRASLAILGLCIVGSLLGSLLGRWLEKIAAKQPAVAITPKLPVITSDQPMFPKKAAMLGSGAELVPTAKGSAETGSAETGSAAGGTTRSGSRSK